MNTLEKLVSKKYEGKTYESVKRRQRISDVITFIVKDMKGEVLGHGDLQERGKYVDCAYKIKFEKNCYLTLDFRNQRKVIISSEKLNIETTIEKFNYEAFKEYYYSIPDNSRIAKAIKDAKKAEKLRYLKGLSFEQLISEAKDKGEKKNRNFAALKKAAPQILKDYASAMLAIGYTSSIFSGKVFEGQTSYDWDSFGEGGEVCRLKFDFENLILIEGTSANLTETGNDDDVFDGEDYGLEKLTEKGG